MEFKTKFSNGDKVFLIRNKRERNFEKCGFCGGEGWIKGANNTSAMCPVCRSRRGETVYGEDKWMIEAELTVGQVRVKYTGDSHGVVEESMFGNMGPQDEEYEESYMCRETGIGCGSIYYSTELFSTQEEAMAECERRNSLAG